MGSDSRDYEDGQGGANIFMMEVMGMGVSNDCI